MHIELSARAGGGLAAAFVAAAGSRKYGLGQVGMGTRNLSPILADDTANGRTNLEGRHS